MDYGAGIDIDKARQASWQIQPAAPAPIGLEWLARPTVNQRQWSAKSFQRAPSQDIPRHRR